MIQIIGIICRNTACSTTKQQQWPWTADSLLSFCLNKCRSGFLFILYICLLQHTKKISLNEESYSYNENKCFGYIIVNKCKICPSIAKYFGSTIHEINDNDADGCSKERMFYYSETRMVDIFIYIITFVWC